MNSWNRWSLEIRQEHNKRDLKEARIMLLIAHLKIAKEHLLNFAVHVFSVFSLVKKQTYVIGLVSVVFMVGFYLPIKTNLDRPTQYFSQSEGRVVKIEHQHKYYTSDDDIGRLLRAHKMWNDTINVP